MSESIPCPHCGQTMESYEGVVYCYECTHLDSMSEAIVNRVADVIRDNDFVDQVGCWLKNEIGELYLMRRFILESELMFLQEWPDFVGDAACLAALLNLQAANLAVEVGGDE